MTEQDRARRVLIYGSCVSRDTFRLLEADHELVAYVARQSAISVGAPASGVSERLPGLGSAFQDRMVRGDIAGDLLRTVERVAASADVVLLDLVDERGGVVRIGGGYVSRLAEFWSSGGRELAQGCPHVAFGSDEHFALWVPAINRVLARFGTFGLRRIVVLATPWADRFEDGTPLEVPDWMMPPAVANTLYARYVDHLDVAGLTVLRLPNALARSSRDHRWGSSPFHYSHEAYSWLADGIRRVSG